MYTYGGRRPANELKQHACCVLLQQQLLVVQYSSAHLQQQIKNREFFCMFNNNVSFPI